MRKRSLLLVAGACLAAFGLTVTSAVADPQPPFTPTSPQFRDLAGTGADGPVGVMNALADLVTVGGTKVIASYDHNGSARIITKADPTPADPNPCDIVRPSNGGQGIAALRLSRDNNDGCLQFARQVTDNSSTLPGANLTYIPYARDALSFVVRDDTTLLERTLTVQNLRDIVNCDPAFAGVRVLLGSFGAGTRLLFLNSLGFQDSATFASSRPCILQGVQENRGIQLTLPNDIAPHSVAQFLSQKNGVNPDSTGRTVLGMIDGISASIVNNNVTIPRDIFNVVPNSLVGTEPTRTVFQTTPTSTALLCQNAATIQKFSFGTHPNCGSTTITTPPN